jgi:hypothetical protein
MVYVVERYLPGVAEPELRRSLTRLLAATQELRSEGVPVAYLGSTIVPEDEACFCQFEGSEGAITEANRRADVPFARIVAAVAVRPKGGALTVHGTRSDNRKLEREPRGPQR